MIKTFLILLGAAGALAMAETRGRVINSCDVGTLEFNFSALPDSCRIDGQGPGLAACPVSPSADLRLKQPYLRAQGGILDLGPLDQGLFDLAITVPATGYGDSARFVSRHLYALRLEDGRHALFIEVKDFIGGCLHQDFHWRLGDTGRTFAGNGVAIRQPDPAPRIGPAQARPKPGRFDLLGRIFGWIGR